MLQVLIALLKYRACRLNELAFRLQWVLTLCHCIYLHCFDMNDFDFKKQKLFVYHGIQSLCGYSV